MKKHLLALLFLAVTAFTATAQNNIYTIADSVDVFYITAAAKSTPSTKLVYRLLKNDYNIILSSSNVVTLQNVNNSSISPLSFNWAANGTRDSITTGSGTVFGSAAKLAAYLQLKSYEYGTPVNITTATATAIKSTSGILNCISVGTAGSGGSTIKVWDGADSTGTLINTFQSNAVTTYTLNTVFKYGLYYKANNVGTLPKATVVYR